MTRMRSVASDVPTGLVTDTSHSPSHSSSGAPEMMPLVASRRRPLGSSGDTWKRGHRPLISTSTPPTCGQTSAACHTNCDPGENSLAGPLFDSAATYLCGRVHSYRLKSALKCYGVVDAIHDAVSRASTASCMHAITYMVWHIWYGIYGGCTSTTDGVVYAPHRLGPRHTGSSQSDQRRLRRVASPTQQPLAAFPARSTSCP